MLVLSVPVRLRLAVTVLFLCIPLIALEVILVTRAPWWKVPYRSIGYWSLTFGLICIPLSVWLISAKKWAIWVAGLLASFWILTSAWVAIQMKYPSLGFFTLVLLFFTVGEIFWLNYEMSRSFFDPQLAWYQGLPKPVPGLKCQLNSGDKSVDLGVSRIDREGAFVFYPSGGGKPSLSLASLLEKKKLDIKFFFRDRQVVCQGIPILSVGKGLGAGIQFQSISPDLRKEIGDFVETLRGEGYV